MTTPIDLAMLLHGLTGRHVALLLASPANALTHLPAGASQEAERIRVLVDALEVRGLVTLDAADASYCASSIGVEAREAFMKAARKLGWSGKGTPPKRLVELLLGAPR